MFYCICQRIIHCFYIDLFISLYTNYWSIFTARSALVQSAVLRSHVVCLSVRPSVCPSVRLSVCNVGGL